MKVGTVLLSKPASVPVLGQDSKLQNVFEGGQGTIRARDRSTLAALVSYRVKNLPRTEFVALRAYLTGSAGANFKQNSFTLIDDWNISYTVFWWDSKLNYEEALGRLYTVKMTFRIVS